MPNRLALAVASLILSLLTLPATANATSGNYPQTLKLGIRCTQSTSQCAALGKQDMEQMDTSGTQNATTQVKTDSTCTTTCTATARSMVAQTSLGYLNIDASDFPVSHPDYGWVYDGFGGQTLPSGPWTFTALVNQVSASSVQRVGVHVNVWKVRLDATTHEPVSDVLMASGTSDCSASQCGVGSGNVTAKATLSFPSGANVSYTNRSLAPGEHLYIALNLVFDTTNGSTVTSGITRQVILYNSTTPTKIDFGSTAMSNLTPAPQGLEILPNGSTASNGTTGGWFTTSNFNVRAYLNDPDWYHHDDFRICNSTLVANCGSNVVSSNSSASGQVITYPFSYANWTGISLSDGGYWLQARTAEDSATGYSNCSPATPRSSPECATSDMTNDPTNDEFSTGYWTGYYSSPSGDQTPTASPSNATFLGVDTTAPSTSVSTSSSSGAMIASGNSVCYDPTAASGASFTVNSGASDATSGVDHVHFPAVSGLGSGGTSGTSDVSSSPYSRTYTFGTGSLTATGSQTLTAYDVATNSATGSFSLATDSAAPSSPTVTGGSSSWRSVSSVVVTASGSTDSGCAGLSGYQYETSTDGGSTWSSATSGASDTITSEGETLVRFRSLDNLGHASSWVSATVRIDRTDPTAGNLVLTPGTGSYVDVLDSPDTLCYAPTIAAGHGFTVAVDATDSISGIQSVTFPSVSSLGAGATNGPQTKTSPTSGSTYSTSGGVYTFGSMPSSSGSSDVVGVDLADNDFATDPVFVLAADSSAPTAPTVSGGSSSWQSVSSVTVSADSSTDTGCANGVSGYKYETSTNGGTTWSSATSGNSHAVTAEGETLVRFEGLDNVGNASTWTTATVRIDRTAPSVPTVAGGSSSWEAVASKTITGSGSTDGGSGIDHYEYRESTDAGTTWSDPSMGSSDALTSEGETVVQFRAVDVAGNASGWRPTSPTAGSTVMLDRTAPSDPTVTGGSLSWQDLTSLTISADASTDALSGLDHYQYRTSTDDGSTWSSATSGAGKSVTAEGQTLVEFRAVDTVGNSSGWTPSPTVADATARIDRSDADPASPHNIGLPAISGTGQVGDELDCANGDWTGAPEPDFTYTWQEQHVTGDGADYAPSPAMSDWTTITGSTTSSPWTPSSADDGWMVRCEVSADNGIGGAVVKDSHPIQIEGSYVAAVLTDDPSGYYRMDSYSFKGSDRSGNGNDLSAYDGAMSNVDDGAVYESDHTRDLNNALTFMNSDDPDFNGEAHLGDGFFSKPDQTATFDFTGSDPFTIDAWVRYESGYDTIGSSKLRVIASKWDQGEDSAPTKGYRLYLDDSTSGYPELCMQLDGEDPYCEPYDLPNNWHHVDATWDGTHIALYEDGTPLGQSTEALTGPSSTQGAGTFTSPRQAFQIGAESYYDYYDWPIGDEFRYPNNFFSGEIDEVSVYSRTLSGDDISTLDSAGANPGASGRHHPGPPVPWVLPKITGLMIFNEPLTVVPGMWEGFPEGVGAETRTYQWQRCSTTDETSCSDISGATGTSYTPGLDDEQAGLRVGESVTDADGGPVTAYSAMTPPIGMSSTAPSCLNTVHATNSCGKSGDPVNDATGALDEQMTDVSLPGPGGGWSFARRYSSDATGTSSILGPGWSVGMDASLDIDSDTGNVAFHTEDGAIIEYAPDYSEEGGFGFGALGAYNAVLPGVTSTLAQDITDGTFTITRQDGTVYHFSSTGVWDSLCDRNDNCTTYTRNDDGHVTSLTDPAGRTITFDYTGSGSSVRLEHINLPDAPGPEQVSYTYDSNGNLATVTNIEGDETQYTYDSSHRITDKYDGNDHHVYHNIYGSSGRITSQTNALGKTTTFSWNASTQVETTKDANNGEWKSYYAGNVLQERIDPVGNATLYKYNSRLLPVKITPPTGHVIEMTYDTDGNMLTRTNLDKGTTEHWATYNSFHEPATYTDARGYTTTYQYYDDGTGNLKRTIDPLNRAIDITYYADGQVETKTTGETYDPDTELVTGGQTTTYTYTDGTDDANIGDLKSVTAPPQAEDEDGPKTTYTYDALGRELTATSPRGNVTGADPADYTTTTSYDDSADTVTVTDPLGDQTVTGYDHAGNRLRQQSGDGTTVLSATEWVYDAGDRLLDVCPVLESDCKDTTDPKTVYDYDDVGSMAHRTDPNGHTTSYEYDAANELRHTTTPHSRETSQVYVDGQMHTTEDPLGAVTTFTYAPDGQVASRDYSDSGTPDVAYTYDEDGNRATMTDGRGTTSYAYDYADELTDICPSGATDCLDTSDLKTAYSYNENGQIWKRSYPDGRVLAYTYWPDGELRTVTDGELTATFKYDADGNVTEIDHGNGLVETRAYDHADRLTQIETKNGDTITYEADYTLDALGRPSKVVRSGDQDITWSYSYDSQGRLTDACRETETDCHGSTDPKLSYTYDANGNRLTSTDLDGNTTTYAYDSNGENELQTVTHPDESTTSYSYDADGRQTHAGDTTYSYNRASQLTGMSTSGVTGSVSFTYDGDGNRLTQDDTRASGQNIAYNWDVNGSLPELESEHDASGLIRQYVRAGSMPLWMQTPDGDSGTTTLDYQTDALGSVAQITDSSGDHACSYAYDPYGEADTSAAGGGIDCAEGVSTSVNPIKYGGEAQDATGLYDLRAREYDPMMGQMLTTDPIDHPGLSPYQYANDVPTFLTDASGMQANRPGAWAIAAEDILGLSGPASVGWDGLELASKVSSMGGALLRSGINSGPAWQQLSVMTRFARTPAGKLIGKWAVPITLGLAATDLAVRIHGGRPILASVQHVAVHDTGALGAGLAVGGGCEALTAVETLGLSTAVCAPAGALTTIGVGVYQIVNGE